MRRNLTAIIFATVVLAGCDQKALFAKFIPQAQATAAKALIASLQSREFQPILNQMDPVFKTPDLPEKLAKMAEFFPPEQPLSIDAVGSNTFLGGDAPQYNLTFQYQFPKKWLLANVAFKENKDGSRTINGLNVYPLTDSLENIHAFRFDGKTPQHFVILAAAALVPLFVLYSLVLCIRTPIPKRKWLWILFILFPIGQLAFSWTEGSFKLNPFSLQMFGGGFFKAGPYAPIILWVALPIGAILFLAKRKGYLSGGVTANLPLEPPAA
jgi:hypothetical protein